MSAESICMIIATCILGLLVVGIIIKEIIETKQKDKKGK